MADEQAQKIKDWQDKLLARFSLNGEPGGNNLARSIAAERETGGEFMRKYYGHRVLTDSFVEFFGATLRSQWAFNNTNGWPQNSPNYVPCFVLYLVTYRSIRASEVLSANGYLLPAYASQRTIKDQLMIIGAAANALMRLDELFGWQDHGNKGLKEEQKQALAIKNRQKADSKIKEKTIGKKSGLALDTQEQLEKWDRLFNYEVHRALFSQTRAAQKLFVDRDGPFTLGPVSDDLSSAMFLNRSTELNWIALRLLPYLRRPETPRSEDWTSKWTLLDESFKFMFDGFNALGKRIAPAYYEMLQAKFNFGPDKHFSEPVLA